MLPQRSHRRRTAPDQCLDAAPEPGADIKPETAPASDSFAIPNGEVNPSGQLWETYVKETDKYDKEMYEDWDRSLDVTLLFAALFSAILTGFLIESLKKLEPDPADTTASTLLDIARILAATSGGQPVAPTPPSDPAIVVFVPSSTALWVNSLWLTSLMLSVGVSLMAMLAKKWCHKFMSGRAGAYREQAFRRQQRWDAIEQWRMQGVMEALSVVMHLALGLFSVGLCIRLWSVNQQVAAPVIGVSCTFSVLYLVATVLPIVVKHCPYETGVSRPLSNSLSAVPKYIVFLGVMCFVFCLVLPVALVISCFQGTFDGLPPNMLQHFWTWSSQKAKSTSDQVVDREIQDTITGRILAWLLDKSESTSTIILAVEAGTDTEVELPYTSLARSHALDQVASDLRRCFVPGQPREPKLSAVADPTHALRLYHVLARLMVGAEYNLEDNLRSAGAHHLLSEWDMTSMYCLLLDQHTEFAGHLEILLAQDMALVAIAYSQRRAPSGTHALRPLVEISARKALEYINKRNNDQVAIPSHALRAICLTAGLYIIMTLEQDQLKQELSLACLRLRLSLLKSNHIANRTLDFAFALGGHHALYRDHISEAYEAGYYIRGQGYYIRQTLTDRRNSRGSLDSLCLLGSTGTLLLLDHSALQPEDMMLVASWMAEAAPKVNRKNTGDLKHDGRWAMIDDWDVHAGKVITKCIEQVPDASIETESKLLDHMRTLHVHFSPHVDLANNVHAVSALIGAQYEELYLYGLYLCKVELTQSGANTMSLDGTSIQSLVRHDLLARTFSVSMRGEPRHSPPAMRRLWTMVCPILAATAFVPDTRVRAFDSLRACDQFPTPNSSWKQELPSSIDELQLTGLWYPLLEEMLSQSPDHLLDAGIIDLVLNHYRKGFQEASAANKPSLTTDVEPLIEKWQGLQERYQGHNKSRHEARTATE